MADEIIVRVGLCGLGTVGGSVIRTLDRKRSAIRDRTGVDIRVQKVYLRPGSPKRAMVQKDLICDDWNAILDDPTIDVVVETLGGQEPALSIIRGALRRGKAAVTANKRLVADELDNLLSEAETRQVYFGLRGAVLGCSPLLHQFSNLPSSARDLIAILNGTCNLILSRMEDGATFESSLSEAQREGYAEADPSIDIDGIDAAQKLSVLIQLFMGQLIRWEDIPTDGIRSVTNLDVEYAKNLGFSIRLLGRCRVTESSEVEARIFPALVPSSHKLAMVRGVSNGVIVVDDLDITREVIHPGAGGDATAAAIISDIVSAARRENPIHLASQVHLQVKSPEDFLCSHYLRVSVEDRPGVLHEVSGVLANHGVSIASAFQRPSGDEPVDIVLMTHDTKEGVMRTAAGEIGDLSCVRATPVRLRTLDPIDEHADVKSLPGR